MSPAVVTAGALYSQFQQRLQLRWLAGHEGADRPLLPHSQKRHDALIGHLNFIHPYCIQVLGATELHYLESLGKNSQHDTLTALCDNHSAIILIGDDLPPPQSLQQHADSCRLPLLASPLPVATLIEHLDHHLRNRLAQRLTLHGVFMDVGGSGVLLTGSAGIGKSELALELITLGHQLIADDAPEFIRTAPDTLVGRCPPLLRGFLEVRGLGILNIRALFGDNAVLSEKPLRLIVHLDRQQGVSDANTDRLRGSHRRRQLLDVEITEVVLPVAAGRNLAVLVETAARAHTLRENGYDAADDFIIRQQSLIEADPQ